MGTQQVLGTQHAPVGHLCGADPDQRPSASAAGEERPGLQPHDRVLGESPVGLDGADALSGDPAEDTVDDERVVAGEPQQPEALHRLDGLAGAADAGLDHQSGPGEAPHDAETN